MPAKSASPAPHKPAMTPLQAALKHIQAATLSLTEAGENPVHDTAAGYLESARRILADAH